MTDVMCDFSAGLKCPRCGYEAPEQRTFRVCRTLDEMAAHVAQVTAKPWISVPNPMLGDRLAHALALVGVILLQKSEGGGLGIGGGTGGGLMTARGAANLLTRSTTVLASLFIVSSIVLAVLAARAGLQRFMTHQWERYEGAALGAALLILGLWILVAAG
jgi:protein translocase SecG subunit